MRYWRYFFNFAAFANLVVGGAMISGADQAAAAIGVSGAGAAYVVALAGLLISVFGVGYGLVARDPIANRNIVVIGALGKAGAAVLASIFALDGRIPHNVFLFGVGDLVLALAFAVFLRQTRAKPTTTPGG